VRNADVLDDNRQTTKAAIMTVNIRDETTTAREATMKAIVRDTYGPPDVLELRDIHKPEISDEEVLVRVHAAGVGRDVWHVMAGLPYPIRLAGYGLRAPKNPVIGSDVAAGWWRRLART
jgi:hypothetical protein